MFQKLKNRCRRAWCIFQGANLHYLEYMRKWRRQRGANLPCGTPTGSELRTCRCEEGGRKMYNWNQASDWLHRIQLKPPFPGHRVQEIIPFFRPYDAFLKSSCQNGSREACSDTQNKAVTPLEQGSDTPEQGPSIVAGVRPQSSQLSNHISLIELLVNRILKCSESYQWVILVFPNYKQKQVSLIAWEKPAIWVKRAKKTSH